MTSTGGITQGLPPLPKSLNSLWSIGRESLSKAEATLGLKATAAATATSGKIEQRRNYIFEVTMLIINK